jgi:hypothetical protein
VDCNCIWPYQISWWPVNSFKTDMGNKRDIMRSSLAYLYPSGITLGWKFTNVQNPSQDFDLRCKSRGLYAFWLHSSLHSTNKQFVNILFRAQDLVFGNAADCIRELHVLNNGRVNSYMTQALHYFPQTLEVVFSSPFFQYPCIINIIYGAVPWFRQLVTGLSPRRPEFDPGSVHVGFVVDKLALGQVFPRVLQFPLSISFHRCCITRKKKTNHLHHRVAQYASRLRCVRSIYCGALPHKKKLFMISPPNFNSL